MISYIIMYLIPSIITISSLKRNKYLWYAIFVIFIFIMGLRYEVGGDWENYIFHFTYEIPKLSLKEILNHSDPGYYLLAYFMIHVGLGVYGINTVVAIIFMLGLMRFAKQQYNPWLVLSVSIPYLLIIVAMGYSRQAAAIGFIMLGLSFLAEKRFYLFLLFIAIATTFHKTAIIMIGIGLFSDDSVNSYIKLIALVFIGFGIYDAFLSQYQEHLWKKYVEVHKESQGAKIRVIMNLIPSIFLLVFKKKWNLYFDDYKIWKIIALASIFMFFIVDKASTAVDRIALYFIVIQLVVFGRLPYLLRNKVKPKFTTLIILFYYLIVLVVWFSFASHAYCWLPYKNIVFYDLI